MNRRITLNESERNKILSMHKTAIINSWINEDEDDNDDIQLLNVPSDDEFSTDDENIETSSDLEIEKFGPLVYITGNGEKFMGSEIDGGWEFYNEDEVIVNMEEMCAALACSIEQLKDELGMGEMYDDDNDDDTEPISGVMSDFGDDDDSTKLDESISKILREQIYR